MIEKGKIPGLQLDWKSVILGGYPDNESAARPDELEEKLHETKKSLREHEQLLRESEKKLQEAQEHLNTLHQERDASHLRMKCLDAIGPPGDGENELAYMARVETSFPGFFDDSSVMFLLGNIARIPEEGIPMEGAGKDYIESLKEEGLDVDDSLFEDGVINRLDMVLLNAHWGNQGLVKQGGKSGSDEALEEVRRQYQERLGINIRDNEILRGLEFNERFTRDVWRQAMREYMEEHPQPAETACEGVQPEGHKTPLLTPD